MRLPPLHIYMEKKMQGGREREKGRSQGIGFHHRRFHQGYRFFSGDDNSRARNWAYHVNYPAHKAALCPHRDKFRTGNHRRDFLRFKGWRPSQRRFIGDEEASFQLRNFRERLPSFFKQKDKGVNQLLPYAVPTGPLLITSVGSEEVSGTDLPKWQDPLLDEILGKTEMQNSNISVPGLLVQMDISDFCSKEYNLDIYCKGDFDEEFKLLEPLFSDHFESLFKESYCYLKEAMTISMVRDKLQKGILKNGKGKAFRMTRQLAKSIEAVDSVKIKDLLKGNFSNIPGQSGGFYKGAPLVIFSAEEECKLAGNFQFTVVGRGSKHISIREAEDFLIKGGYKEFKLRRLSPKEIIFIFKHEEDYLRWFHRRRWTIKGNLINLTKWTPEHSSSKDCPIIPLWVEVSKLPLHLHDHNVLYAIASSLGKPLKLDSNSVIGVFPDRTRFCVEMDVSISKAPKIHVRLGAKDLWLPCSYENHTPYCSSCSRFGHAPKDCRIKGPENLTVAAPPSEVGPAGEVSRGRSTDEGWIWVKGRSQKHIANQNSVGQSNSKVYAFPDKPTPHSNNFSSWKQTGYSKLSKKVAPQSEQIMAGPITTPLTEDWESLMPTIEEIQEEEPLILSSIIQPHASDLESFSPIEVVEDSPFPDLSYLKVDNIIGCMDIVPFVPLSNHQFDDEKPLVSMVTIPGSKDDCWIHPNMVCGLEGHEKDAQEEVETPIHCHSEGEEGAKPFINGNLVPLDMDLRFCSQVPIPLPKFSKSKREIPPSGMMTRSHEKDAQEEVETPIHCHSEGEEEPKGSLFTWSGVRSQGRTWRRLDRVLLNLDTMASFEDLALTHLPRANSDHKPLLLSCLDTPPSGAKPFKFLNDWNSSHFGNIFLKLKEAEEIASKAQETYELDPSDLNCEGAQLANAQLIQAVNREVSYWKQKANEFFLGLPIPKGYGSTFISLIPKKDNPKTFDDFRPISLSTFMSKINTKLLANRLKTLLPKIISEEQAAFQKGKSCDDHILLEKEAIHHLDKKTFGGNVIIKVDMAKAFDRMEWSYIEHILKGFGFSDGAISILMANLKNTFLSILLNGREKGAERTEQGRGMEPEHAAAVCRSPEELDAAG
ncbi:unnamed protein product [Cuscuta campestris]|uniref:Reverse transcriptase domain-containing protein n=1 Tax=Cuscuta campestris TaxID=132261 RepID=A0A484L955_9ASTE|nr:unnamed protein product [Cuscuta campestris]